ncbi:UBP19 [Symbiodinium sp. CCMP2592]|nr:UBP19 [Symbiodinium sp. CCMP2592]
MWFGGWLRLASCGSDLSSCCSSENANEGFVETIKALPVCDVKDNQRFWLDLQGFWYRETDNRCVGEVCENRLVWHVQWDVSETVTSLQAVTQDTVVYKRAGRVISGVVCWHAQPSISWNDGETWLRK